MPLSQIEDLADTRLAQKISQVTGVGLVSINGGQKPAVRIQANPTALSSYGINLEDMRNAISAANVNQAKGSFDGPAQAYQIGANDQLLNSDGLREPHRRLQERRPGAALRRGQGHRRHRERPAPAGGVGQQAGHQGRIKPAIILNIQRQPGANIISVVDNITKLLPKLRQSDALPPIKIRRSPTAPAPSAPRSPT